MSMKFLSAKLSNLEKILITKVLTIHKLKSPQSSTKKFFELVKSEVEKDNRRLYHSILFYKIRIPLPPYFGVSFYLIKNYARCKSRESPSQGPLRKKRGK